MAQPLTEAGRSKILENGSGEQVQGSGDGAGRSKILENGSGAQVQGSGDGGCCR